MDVVNELSDLKVMAELAEKILDNKTIYIKNKKIISRVFKDNSKDKVIFRLSVIDGFYSTQMNRRLYGIEDLADGITAISKSDDELRKLFTKYVEYVENKTILSSDDKIGKLLNSTFGIDKSGHIKKKAVSLITKYAFFLTDYKFPIYDTLVKYSYEILHKRFSNELDKMPDDYKDKFFVYMKNLKNKTGITTFNAFDNLLWLMGKVTSGSLSLVLDSEVYKKILDMEPLKEKLKSPSSLKSSEIDDVIREFIKTKLNSKSLKEIISKELLLFMKLAFELSDYNL